MKMTFSDEEHIPRHMLIISDFGLQRFQETTHSGEGRFGCLKILQIEI